MKQSDLIFALDIGTRSVIGVVGEARGEMFHVLYMAKEEHSKRAMMDGQIEDIDQVAKIVKVIKARLEEQIGHPLTRVCLAAAGRSLRMERARAKVELEEVQNVTDEFISQLEAVAIAEAEEKLSEHNKDQRFYLVGYTVAQYLLDRYPMTTIKGHNGRIMEAEVVATFLPSQVVEGLYSVVQIAGLEVASLTLEPIAALNATIPPDLRLLNLVLVDIGAGTSDIAVCRDGSVVGYTMATTAGDEITEMLMKHFLIDFATAENLKTNLSAGEIKYVNVLGNEENTTGHQISEAVAEATKTLVKEVAKEIRAINGCSPAAVFMAGGGSKLEGITEMLAGYLEIQNHRIAVAGSNYNRTIVAENFQLDDPEYATPLGIAVSAGLGLINDSYHITLNGKGAKLFRSGSLTLLDILMMNGFTAASLIGRTGKNLAIMINGNKKIIRGKASIPGILRLNGEAAPTSALVSAGDIIDFVPAIDGEHAQSTLQEFLGDYAGKVLLNGQEVSWDTMLVNGDAITTLNSDTTPTVAQRRFSRPITAAELRPVDAAGNPVALPPSAVQSFDDILAEHNSVATQAMDSQLESARGSRELPSEAGHPNDKITPIPLSEPVEGKRSLSPEPQGKVSPDDRAVVKPIPESLNAVDFSVTMESSTPSVPEELPTEPTATVLEDFSAPLPQEVPPLTERESKPSPSVPEASAEVEEIFTSVPPVPEPAPVAEPTPVPEPTPLPPVPEPAPVPEPTPLPPVPEPAPVAEPTPVPPVAEPAPVPEPTPVPPVPEPTPVPSVVEPAPVPPVAEPTPVPPVVEPSPVPEPTPVPPVVEPSPVPEPTPLPPVVEPAPVPEPTPLPPVAEPSAFTGTLPSIPPLETVEEAILEPLEDLDNTKPLPKVQPIQEQVPVDSAVVMPSLAPDFPTGELPKYSPESLSSLEASKPQVESAPSEPVPAKEGRVSLTQGTVTLNGTVLQLPPKADGSPYYLMDLLDKTDIDFRRVSKPILMLVNGQEGFFVQHLHENDHIIIEEQK